MNRVENGLAYCLVINWEGKGNSLEENFFRNAMQYSQRPYFKQNTAFEAIEIISSPLSSKTCERAFLRYYRSFVTKTKGKKTTLCIFFIIDNDVDEITEEQQNKTFNEERTMMQKIIRRTKNYSIYWKRIILPKGMMFEYLLAIVANRKPSQISSKNDIWNSRAYNEDVGKYK